MKKGNAVAFEIGDIHFCATTNKVVHYGNLVPLGPQMKRYVRSNEPATASDEKCSSGSPLNLMR